MLRIASNIIEQAEEKIENGGDLSDALSILRRLSLDHFGQLMFSLPNPRYSRLSDLLPSMAEEAVQKRFTGSTGDELLYRSLGFMALLENNYVRYVGRSIRNEKILDFGVGYGRMVRLLYYYTDPNNIWGLDPHEDALDSCREAGLLGNIHQSQSVPQSLPVDGQKFNLSFAFSVFSHLAPHAASACLEAVRDITTPGGIFMPTIWPPEIWNYFDRVNKTKDAPALIKDYYDKGFAYVPHGGKWGETFGNATVAPELFEKHGWEVLGYDSTLRDVFQIVMILRKK